MAALVAAVVVGVVGSPCHMVAQAVPQSVPPQSFGPGGVRQSVPGGQFGPAQPPAGAPRQQLEQRLRQQFEQIVRQRLQLTDAQVAQLRATNQQFAPQRRDLATRERQIRQAMRAELQPGTAPDETRLSTLIDSLFALQRQRIDMLQSEQHQLATFLTPSQRVRYYALQEQLRRRVEQMRQRQQMMQGMQGGAQPAP
jgi:hypothetical protein